MVHLQVCTGRQAEAVQTGIQGFCRARHSRCLHLCQEETVSQSHKWEHGLDRDLLDRDHAPNSCHRPSSLIKQRFVDLLKAIASESGSVVYSTSKSAIDLSRVEGVAAGCSGSEVSKGSRRLTSSAAPSPSEWLGEATTMWTVQASLTMFRDLLCDLLFSAMRYMLVSWKGCWRFLQWEDVPQTLPGYCSP